MKNSLPRFWFDSFALLSARLPRPHRSRASAPAVLLASLSAGLLAASPSAAPAQTTATLTTLHSFLSDTGSEPVGNLVQGDDGNFYGTTQVGGNGGGTVFRITPAGVATNLYAFPTSGLGTPAGGLSKGNDGSFYGVTTNDSGTVFKITPAGVFTIMHIFADGTVPLDGTLPEAPPVQGSDGNFYGTTYEGGANGDGTVYRMTPAGAVTILHSFGGDDGANPDAALVQGSDGNFYGTTFAGGGTTAAGGNLGTAFQITPSGGLTSLHTFTSDDGGGDLVAPLVQGSDGNFYGTTAGDGKDGSSGTIFQLAPTGGFKVLHAFAVSDGDLPMDSLVQGSDGAFYGTTSGGGADSYGTVFRITAAGDFTVLHSFVGSDGLFSTSGLIQSSDGTFYGLTKLGGGTGGFGTFFKLDVSIRPAFFAGETPVGNGVYFLAFPGGNYFGFYSFLSEPGYLYHFDLGYEYVIDANDGQSGIYLYDFKSKDFFYTSPGFPFPYLYDFGLQSIVYYYPDPNNAGHYNTDGVRYFYVFSNGQTITK